MRRWLVLATSTLLSCAGGQLSQTCPDGEPVIVLKKVQDAYPAYVREYETNVRLIQNLVSKPKASDTSKAKSVRLRQELDQERLELENEHKSLLVALQTNPCNKEVSSKAIDFLVDIKTKTNRIANRVKQTYDDASDYGIYPLNLFPSFHAPRS